MKKIIIGQEYRAKGFKTSDGDTLRVKVIGVDHQASDGNVYQVREVNNSCPAEHAITTLHETYLTSIRKESLSSDGTIDKINRRKTGVRLGLNVKAGRW
jgi:hypothetical protein